MLNKIKIIIILVSMGFSGVLFAASETQSSSKSISTAGSVSNSAAGSSASGSASQQIKTILAPVQSLTASFQQKMINDKGSVLQESEGMMWLKKPGQFRWEVKGKDKRLVVSNGKQVWDFDQDLDQVTIQRFSKNDAKAPIFFLTGDVNSLDRDFKIEIVKASGKNCMKESDHCFMLSPKSEQSPFQNIKIGFKDNVLREMEMIDQLNQHSYFIFHNTQLNPSVAPKLFQFVPPKGVDVVGG